MHLFISQFEWQHPKPGAGSVLSPPGGHLAHFTIQELRWWEYLKYTTLERWIGVRIRSYETKQKYGCFTNFHDDKWQWSKNEYNWKWCFEFFLFQKTTTILVHRCTQFWRPTTMCIFVSLIKKIATKQRKTNKEATKWLSSVHLPTSPWSLPTSSH